MWLRSRALLLGLVIVVGAGGGEAGAHGIVAHGCTAPTGRSLVLLSARTGAVARSYPGVDGVLAIVADGRSGWFVSGGFTCVRNTRRSDLVRLNAKGGVARAWRAALPGRHPEVTALAVAQGTLYAAGAFGVVALDAATGARRWVARVGESPDAVGILALAANAHAVYVGGGFRTVDGMPRPSLAALDARTGRPIAWHQPVVGGSFGVPTVDALAVAGARLYLGGTTIGTIDGQRRPGFAAIDADTGRLSSWTPGTAPGLVPGAGVGDVETILVADGEVFSAGHDGFGIVDARTGAIARWMREIQGVASRFASYGDTVYLGGNERNSFTRVGRVSRNNLAALDLAGRRFTGWAPEVGHDVDVEAMAADRSDVLVGGGFSR